MSPTALFLLLITFLHPSHAKPPPLVPAILIFGDSTVDTGNNNYILTPVRADHPPYGRDFPGRLPTGRFSNGKLVPDILAAFGGLKETVPPFLDPNLSDQDIVTGVNFASAGSGYDELTASISRAIPVSKQPALLKEYIRRLKGIVGGEEAARIVGGALVAVSAGSNDFVFNFYDVPSRRAEFSIDEYQDFLLNKLQNVVEELYDLGCRIIVVAGVPPIGCLPIQRTAKFPILRGCSYRENADAESYNRKLEKMVGHLEAELPGSTILYADLYNPLLDIINYLRKYGFIETERGCCGSGVVEVGPLCTPLTPLCANTSQYIFYDSVHPAESTYTIIAQNLIDQLLPKLPISHKHM